MKIEQIGVVTTPYWHYTLEYALSSIAASGFQNIEFWAASPHYCYADYTPEERIRRRAEICSLIQSFGLRMPVFYPEQMNKYPLNIAAAEPHTKKFSMSRVLEYVDDAKAFGAGAMMLGTGWYHLDAPSEEKYQRAVTAIQRVADYAAQQGITMLIESASPVLGSFAWGLDSLTGLLGDVDRENVKACLDLAGILDADDNVDRWMGQLNGKVGHIHFADKGGRVPSTDGDVANALQRVEALGYRGTMSLNITFRDCCLTPDWWIFTSGLWLRRHMSMLLQ